MNGRPSESAGALVVVSRRASRSAGIDSVRIAADGLAGGLRQVLGRADVLTRSGLTPIGDLSASAAVERESRSLARSIVRALPGPVRSLVGDVRAAVDGSRRRPLPQSEHRYSLVVQFHGRFDRTGIRLARQLGVPLVLRVEALEIREEEAWGRHRLGAGPLIERLGETTLLRVADLNAAVSEELATQLAEIGVPPERRCVVPNGVDVDMFSPGEPDESLRRQLGEDRFIVGWVGGFRPFHGLELLPEIANGLRVRVPNAVLCLMGSGPDWEATHTLASRYPNVRVLPAVPYSAVPRWIRTFNACLLLAVEGPFHYSPLKLLEYMACGRPVIAPAIGDVGSILSDGIDALVVPPGDATAVVSAIETVERDPALAGRLASNARQSVARTASWEARARQLLTHVDERVRRLQSAASALGAR